MPQQQAGAAMKGIVLQSSQMALREECGTCGGRIEVHGYYAHVSERVEAWRKGHNCQVELD